MTMEYFTAKADALTAQKLPKWVSDRNKSYAAYLAVSVLSKSKREFIRQHDRKTEYRRKSDWQITGAELARAIGVRTTTILHNTTYSNELRAYIASSNAVLEKDAVSRIKRSKDRRSNGPIMRNKSELVSEVQSLRARVKELEEANVKGQVEEVIEMLPLPILKKLGLT